jgi:hypothetical protein
MKIEQFKLRGNYSVCAGAFRLLHGLAPAQLRGNIACKVISIALKIKQIETVPKKIKNQNYFCLF